MVAEIGNQYAQKWRCAKELEAQCHAYMYHCKGEKIPMTMPGLMCWLDVCDDTFGDYIQGQRDEPGNKFSETLKKARKFVEADKLQNALNGKYNSAIAIFDLKNNHGYADKVDTTVKDVTPKIVRDDIPDE